MVAKITVGKTAQEYKDKVVEKKHTTMKTAKLGKEKISKQETVNKNIALHTTKAI